jgi:aspartate aminotransferase-like enzyme
MGAILSPGDSVVVPNFGEFSGRLGDSASYTGANVLRPLSELGDAPKIENWVPIFALSGVRNVWQPRLD